MRVLFILGTNMLTATYSIIALKIEQNRARWTFSSLQQYILGGIRNLGSASGMDFEPMLQRLSQFEQYCQQRKMDMFVIPALRKFTHEADSLLDELESLSAASITLLRSLQDKLRLALRSGTSAVEEICATLEQCCAHFYRRLTREEELVSIAERVIPSEAWFGIAASFLSQDGRHASPPATDEEE